MTAKRPMWTPPYGLREALVAVAALLTTGFLLQVAAGPFDYYLLTFPGSALACLLLMAIGAGLGLAAHRGRATAQWLAGAPMAVALTAGFMLLAILMGSVPQLALDATPGTGVTDRLGLSAMTSSWPMVFCYSATCACLAGAVTRRLTRLNIRRDATFLTAHLGFLVLLLGAGVGSADLSRYIMYVPMNETEWRVYAGAEKMVELPVAISLHAFTLEEFPPKLLLIDGEGQPLPHDKPVTWQIDPRNPDGRLGDWDLHVDEFIPRAVYQGNDSFRPMEIPGAAPAVKVTATPRGGGEPRTGWISGGNMDNFLYALQLEDSLSMAVTPADPKRFASDVTVLVRGTEPVRTTIEVNHPLRVGSWIIYQYGYDAVNGRYAHYSSFELVADPWLPVVYLGLALLALSACLLIWNGRGRRPAAASQRAPENGREAA